MNSNTKTNSKFFNVQFIKVTSTLVFAKVREG